MMSDSELLILLSKRRKFFDELLPKLEGADFRNDVKGLSNTCPSCGFPTLGARCSWEICLICFWEDDGQDDPDADETWGGPNGNYSLTQHRIEWLRNLEEMKKSDFIGKELTLADNIIFSEDVAKKEELLKLVDSIEQYFGKKRGLQK